MTLVIPYNKLALTVKGTQLINSNEARFSEVHQPCLPYPGNNHPGCHYSGFYRKPAGKSENKNTEELKMDSLFNRFMK